MATHAAHGEAAAIGRLVHDFCWCYAPTHLTSSEHTLRGYRSALELYLRYLDTVGVTPATLSASDFCRERIESFLAWLSDERGNSPRTCNVRLSAIRVFCRYASRHDATMVHLEAESLAVPNRKAPKTKVKGLSREAVRALAFAPDPATRQGARDRAIIVTLYATACRVSELTQLRVRDLFLDAGDPHVFIRGKGGKVRVAYLPEKAVGHLRSHVASSLGKDPSPDAFVFWSREHPAGESPITTDAVTKMLQRHARSAHASCPDLPVNVTPHRIRHARATHWLEDGMSIAQVSMLLGHSNIQVTMDYLDISVDAKSEAMRCVPGVPDASESRWKGPEAASLLALCGLTPANP